MDKNWLKKNLANIVTSLRIIGTTVMLIMPTLSTGFLIAYGFAGLTDAVDGTIARKFNATSEFGAKLDSIADLFLFVTMMIKILPVLIQVLPHAVMLAIYAIFAFRVLIYLCVGIKEHRLLSTHQILNKATGAMLYFVPFVIKTKFFTIYASIVCAIAALAALNEVRMLFSNVH